MAQKRFGDWTDNLMAESNLPSDEFTFTTGNNFGLDGFQFDEPDNQGPEDGGRLPSTRGLSGLPDGLVTSREQDLSFVDLTDDSESGLGINLSAMLSEEEGGLPKDASLMDLEWLDPTQGQDPSRLPDNLKKLNASPQLEEAWGANRQTNGLRIVPNTDKEAANYRASLKQKGPQYRKTPEEVRHAFLRAVRRAHYGDKINTIQAELLDTLGDESHRVAEAMQTLRDEHDLLGKVYVRASAFPGIKNGKWVSKIKESARTAHYVITDDQIIADKLGMVMVKDVPWKAALAYYAPRLAGAGYRVASNGSPKEILRNAFRVGPVSAPIREGFKPVVKPEIATMAQAKAAMAAPRQVQQVQTANDRVVQAKQKEALLQLAKWVKAGSLSQKDALKLKEANVDSHTMLRLASKIMTTGKTATDYRGSVQRAAIQQKIVDAPKLSPQMQKIMRVASASGIKAGEFVALLKWARQQMSEGTMGVELNELMKARFTPPLRKAAKELLKEVRASHEGLSGHLYVDAAAYASVSGTTGCEQGASKHRTNGLKYVLAMSRCAGCTFANANGVCTQYNKKLADEPPVKNPKAYQARVLQLADAEDSEVTASMFSPNEFNLRNEGLEDVHVAGEVSVEQLGEVLFGGLEV